MRLAIGAAQFGMFYGINNTIGQPNILEIKKVLDYAKSIKINTIDTAASYGNSEEILGIIGVGDWNVMTKIPPLNSTRCDCGVWVKEQVRFSMSKLKTGALSTIILHHPQDLIADKTGDYVRSLKSLRDDGIVGQIGYSIYSPEILPDLVKILMPDLVQAPFNVFDQRIRSSGWLSRLLDGGVKVHARSVFLQGLLLMQPNSRPSYFKKWAALFSKWDELLKQASCTPVEAALNFVLQEKSFEKIVVGVNSLAELMELADVCKCPLDLQFNNLISHDSLLIDPFRWRIH